MLHSKRHSPIVWGIVIIGLLFFFIKFICTNNLFSVIQPNENRPKITPPHLQVFSYATDPNHPMLKLLLHSSPYPITVLGLHEPWHNLRQKFEVFHRYLSEHNLKNSNEILLFVDGYDALFTPKDQDIIKKFKAFHKPLVISAEKNCTPHPACVHPEIYPTNAKENASSPFKYPNSGTYIGYASTIYQMLDEVLKKYPTDRYPEASNDQFLMHAFFIEHPEKVALDYHQEIFSLLYETKFKDFSYDPKTKTLRNRITNSTPIVLHGNGRSFVLFELYFNHWMPKLDFLKTFFLKLQVALFLPPIHSINTFAMQRLGKIYLLHYKQDKHSIYLLYLSALWSESVKWEAHLNEIRTLLYDEPA